jgi:hypothetical protein
LFISFLLEPYESDKSVSKLTLYLLPLCGGTDSGVHERVCNAAIDVMTTMSTVLCSTTENMHFLADYMQVYMLNPLVNKNKTIMHVIGQSEKCYASIIEHLLERKYLVPALVEAGIIPMIEVGIIRMKASLVY